MIRIGTVTNVFKEGRTTVYFEDTGNTSLPIPVVAVNNEYVLPKVGSRVITLHLDNSSSKGFVLGGYYDGGDFEAPEDSDYQKSVPDVIISAKDGNYLINAEQITLKTSKHEITLDSLIERIEALEGGI